MDWFGQLFLVLLIIALITKKAYFRGVVTQSENPKKYREIVLCYAALAFFSLMMPGGGSRYPMFSFLTDAATRVAYDIKYTANQLECSSENSMTVIHKPRSFPEGCSTQYKLQISRGSSIIFWCMDAEGKITSSHSTTYYRRFAHSPKTYTVTKGPGETTFIDLEKVPGDKPIITNVR